MTLAEAITHAREVAIEQSSIATELSLAGTDANKCIKCKQEHEQLEEWLEELKQYRTIGTVDECRAAVEKQKAKKPIPYKPWDGKCPVCSVIFTSKLTNYCGNCGQRLDWSDEE